MRLFATILEQVFRIKKENKKLVPDLETIIRDRDKIIYGESKNKKEEKVFEPFDFNECGCLPDCGCKE